MFTKHHLGSMIQILKVLSSLVDLTMTLKIVITVNHTKVTMQVKEEVAKEILERYPIPAFFKELK
jgi:hypothetical protein